MSKIEVALAGVGVEASEAFHAHLRGGTSAAWLRDWLERAGYKVGVSAVKEYRKKVQSDSR